MNYYVGIDVGGTKIYALVINEEGHILSRAKLKIGGNTKFKLVLKKILECYHTACREANISERDLKAIGLEVPSSIDYTHRIIKHAPNLG